MQFTISDEKLAEITELINDAQPSATESEVLAYIVSDWPEGDDHQSWLHAAGADEIADWVIAGIWG